MTERTESRFCMRCGGRITDWLMCHEPDDCIESLLRERDEWNVERDNLNAEIAKLNATRDNLRKIIRIMYDDIKVLTREVERLTEERDAHAQMPAKMPRTLE